MAGDAQNLAVGKSVAAAGSNGSFMMRFPAPGSIVFTAIIPIQHLVTPITAMTTGGATAFTSSARTLPGTQDYIARKSHLLTCPFSGRD